MKNRHIIAIALGMILVLGVNLSNTPGAGKPGSDQPHANGVLDNSSGYKITGDSTGSTTLYADGVGGVSNIIWTSNSGDYVQNLAHTQRYINYDFSDKVSGSTINAPLQDGGPVNVRRLGQVTDTNPCGTVGFWTAVGQLSFGDPNNPGCSQNGSSNVTIERIGPSTWDVRTEPGADIAILLQQAKGGKTIEIGKYRMPIHMIISCVSNCTGL